MLVGLDGITGNRQTENAGINTQDIMGTNGRHLVGGGDKHKTGETDQGVTYSLRVPESQTDTAAPGSESPILQLVRK